jgi:hypothetical protein
MLPAAKCQPKMSGIVVARIPKSGIFLSGCKDTVCKGFMIIFFELLQRGAFKSMVMLL